MSSGHAACDFPLLPTSPGDGGSKNDLFFNLFNYEMRNLGYGYA